MLSRRDKLLVQPWEKRRFNEHRSKVQSTLPAIDDRPPRDHPHVVAKPKKCQKEMDRKIKIQNDNFTLLQRLNAIMKVNRLDNHWSKPLPRPWIHTVYHTHPDLTDDLLYIPSIHQKVGMFYDDASLRSRLTARSASTSDSDDTCFGVVKCYACDLSKRNQPPAKTTVATQRYCLPTISFQNLTQK